MRKPDTVSMCAGPCPACRKLSLTLCADGTFDCGTITIAENVLTGERGSSRCPAKGTWERSGGAVGAIKIKRNFMMERTVCGKCGAEILNQLTAMSVAPASKTVTIPHYECDSLMLLRELTKSNPGKVTIMIESNVSIGGAALQEIKTFDTRQERDEWVKANLVKYGGFPTVYEMQQ